MRMPLANVIGNSICLRKDPIKLSFRMMPIAPESIRCSRGAWTRTKNVGDADVGPILATNYNATSLLRVTRASIGFQ